MLNQLPETYAADCTPDMWRKNVRTQLLEHFAASVYGYLPLTPPWLSYDTRLIDDAAFEGAATLKEIKLIIDDDVAINLLVTTPNNVESPPPAFLFLNSYGNKYNIKSQPILKKLKPKSSITMMVMIVKVNASL
ncbi:MAG: hypothetical protein GC136_01930 [Alphaproteobacteria bacterium]|nr:hypothetical protein [Alphaproteobacteria bacterium]